jgi:GT2 family glycosyltransferase
MSGPLISVGVPVWQGAGFVAETLESILGQRDVRLRVFISIDGADAASERACEPFTADPRVRLVVQPERLGWVRNSTAVLAEAIEAGADYACIQPHDDVLAEDYLAALLTIADKSNAAAVFCDIEAFGTESGIIRQPSVIGRPVVRQISLLCDHFDAVAYRCLARAAVLARALPIPGNPFDDFAADTVWVSRLALTGELLRVPRVLYRKRFHANNTHRRWSAWPLERKKAAWTRHCLDMLGQALQATTGPNSRQQVMEATRARLLLLGVPLGPFAGDIATMPLAERLRMLSAFEAAAGGDALSTPKGFGA